MQEDLWIQGSLAYESVKAALVTQQNPVHAGVEIQRFLFQLHHLF